MTSVSSNPLSTLDAIDVPTGGLALLAFVMALYALAAREQKTPYIINSVYSTAFVVLLAISFSIIGKVLNSSYPLPARISKILALVVFAFGIVNVLFRVWHIRNRKLNFRDDRLFSSLKMVRSVKHFWRRIRPRTYEHNTIGLGEPLLKSIMNRSVWSETQIRSAVDRKKNNDGIELSLSAGCQVSTFAKADELIAELAQCFLEHECWVQYASCARHPIEFILHLKKVWLANHEDQDWKKVSSRIIVADVYTPHFGFTDSIHDEVTATLTNLGVECITAKASYAGLHSAAARAFNIIRARAKKQGESKVRLPTLVIYDGPHALVELESLEQYRIFIRHLIPSERLWGGMFTVVVESAISHADIALLRSYADLFADLSEDDKERQVSHKDMEPPGNNRVP